MHQQENRKIIPKEERSGYAEQVKRICKPLFAGLIPWLCGLLLYLPFIVCASFDLHGYVLALSALLLGIWGYLGYRLYDKDKWLVNGLLFLVFPVTGLCLLMLNAVNVDDAYVQAAGMPGMIILTIFTQNYRQENLHFVWNFAACLVCFLAGIHVRMWRDRCEQRRKADPAEKPWWHVVAKLTLICLVIIAVLIAPACVTVLGPVDQVVEPQSIESWFAQGECLPAEIREAKYEVVIGETFPQILRTGEWERKYTYFGIGEELAKLYADDGQPGYLCFYSNGVVKAYCYGGFLWPITSVAYYKIPEEVTQNIIHWIKADHTADQT